MPAGCLGKEDCCRGAPAMVRLGSGANAGSDASPTAQISAARAKVGRRRRHCGFSLGLLWRHLACGPPNRARPGSGNLTNMNSDALGQQIPQDLLEAEIDAEAHDIVSEMVVPGVGVGIEAEAAWPRSVCKYSRRRLRLRLSAYSAPPRAAQPTRIPVLDALTVFAVLRVIVASKVP